MEEEQKRKREEKEEGFATASGKKIKVSEKSLQAAMKLIGEKPNSVDSQVMKKTENEDKSTKKFTREEVVTWNVEKVKEWFLKLGLQKDYSSLLEENQVNGQLLVKDLASKEDLVEFGITLFGDVRKFLRARAELLQEEPQEK